MYLLRISLPKKWPRVVFYSNTDSGTWENFMVSLTAHSAPHPRRRFCSHEIETQMVQVTYPILWAHWRPWGSSDVLDSPPSAHCFWHSHLRFLLENVSGLWERIFLRKKVLPVHCVHFLLSVNHCLIGVTANSADVRTKSEQVWVCYNFPSVHSFVLFQHSDVIVSELSSVLCVRWDLECHAV